MNYESNNSKSRFTKLLIYYPKLDNNGGLKMQSTSRRTISKIIWLQNTYTRSAEYVPPIKVHVYGSSYTIFSSMNGQMDGRDETNAKRIKQITYIWKTKKTRYSFPPRKIKSMRRKISVHYLWSRCSG